MLRIAPQGLRSRGRQRLAQRVYGGYSYVFARKEAGVTFVKCNQQLLNNCNAYGRIVNREVVLLREHSHPADQRLRTANEVVATAYVAVTTEMRSICAIYNRLMNQHPESSELFEKIRFLRRMYQWRDTLKVETVPTYTELVAQLVSVDRRVCRVHDRGIVDVTLASDNGVSEAVIFFDSELINTLSECTTFIIGSTTKIVPINFEDTQELVVVTAIYQKYAFPCVWALMRHRSVRAYLALLHPLAASVTPEDIYTNYDARLQEAITATFPEASVHGHYAAYCMTVLDTAREMGLNLDQPAVRKGVKQVLGLALLPYHQIGDAFNTIVASVHREHNREFAMFLDSVDGTWIQVVTPEQFSVYRRPDAVTNCSISNIQRFANRVGAAPDIGKFTNELIRSYVQVHVDVSRRRENANISITPRVNCLVNRTHLARLWRQISREDIGADRFLEICDNFLESLLALLIYRQGPILQDFHAYAAVARDEAGLNRDGNIEDAYREINEAGGIDARGVQEAEVLPDTMQEDEDGNVTRCIICRTNGVQYACMPCLHVAFCQTCSQTCERNSATQRRSLRCPLCRSPSIGFSRVYLPSDM